MTYLLIPLWCCNHAFPNYHLHSHWLGRLMCRKWHNIFLNSSWCWCRLFIIVDAPLQHSILITWLIASLWLCKWLSVNPSWVSLSKTDISPTVAFWNFGRVYVKYKLKTIIRPLDRCNVITVCCMWFWIDMDEGLKGFSRSQLWTNDIPPNILHNSAVTNL